MAAEAFLVAEGLGSEWQVIENIPWETTELLRATAEAGVRYVALDPPSVLTRETRNRGWSRSKRL